VIKLQSSYKNANINSRPYVNVYFGFRKNNLFHFILPIRDKE
jgi:hypothetical protein